jgi:hypothetical protein
MNSWFHKNFPFCRSLLGLPLFMIVSKQYTFLMFVNSRCVEDNIALRYVVGQCAVRHKSAGFLFGWHITSLKVKGTTNYGVGHGKILSCSLTHTRLKFHINVILSLGPGQYFKQWIRAKYNNEWRIPVCLYLVAKLEASYLTQNSVIIIIDSKVDE